MPSKPRGSMIGKSLQERHGLTVLDDARAVGVLGEILASHARPIVEVRAQDARMIACVVPHADEASVRLCRRFGFELRPGGVGVFGVLGDDALRLITGLSEERASWLTTPCGPRETKVVLIAAGIALLSLATIDGKVTITPR